MKHAAAGYTLIELMVVASLLAIIAGVVKQSAALGSVGRLDAAASEVVGALRYARVEAIRTRALHGVDFGKDVSGVRRIRVFRVAGGTPPAAVYDVRHPVSKALFDVRLSSHPGAAGVELTGASFFYKASGGTIEMRDWIAFDATGRPEHYLDPTTYDVYQDAALVGFARLVHAGHARLVLVDAVTGRVTTN